MKRAWAFLVLATVAGSPVWAQQKIDQIVARVNGDIVLKSEVDRELDLRRIEMAQQGMDAARINVELAGLLKGEEAVRYYTAARALRLFSPETLAARRAGCGVVGDYGCGGHRGPGGLFLLG